MENNLDTPRTILDALGHEAVAQRLGVAIRRVRRAYDEPQLPALWYGTLREMAGRDLPLCMFTFKRAPVQGEAQ